MNTAGIIGHARQLKVLELIAQKGTVPGCLLFSGKSGIGKRLIARRFLASLFCASGNPPCLKCPVCLQIEGNTYPDLIELRPDEKGTIPIGNADRPEPGTIRWLIDRLSKKSVSGTYGVIIDGAEAVSTGGQNALLKTVEEPQSGAHIIIITANKSLILPTILSRSMEISFNPLDGGEVMQAMGTGVPAGADAGIASLLSGGSVETALALSNEKNLAGIADLCREISVCVSAGGALKLDMAALQKNIGIEQVLDVLLNVYRVMLSTDIDGVPLHPYLSELFIGDREKLVKIIKILLALRKGLSNNLNIRGALKGMLYSIDRIGDFGLPKLDCTE